MWTPLLTEEALLSSLRAIWQSLLQLWFNRTPPSLFPCTLLQRLYSPLLRVRHVRPCQLRVRDLYQGNGPHNASGSGPSFSHNNVPSIIRPLNWYWGYTFSQCSGTPSIPIGALERPYSSADWGPDRTLWPHILHQVIVSRTPDNPVHLGYNVPLIRDGSKTEVPYPWHPWHPWHCLWYNKTDVFTQCTPPHKSVLLELLCDPAAYFMSLALSLLGTDPPTGMLIHRGGETRQRRLDIRALCSSRVCPSTERLLRARVPLISAQA